jgi:hypothetical protein
MMKRDRYGDYVLQAEADKLRDQPTWQARVRLEDVLRPGTQPPYLYLEGQEFSNQEDAIDAALAFGRTAVDALPKAN